MSGFLSFDDWGGFTMDPIPTMQSTPAATNIPPSMGSPNIGLISDELATVLGRPVLSEQNVSTVSPMGSSINMLLASPWIPYALVFGIVGGADYFLERKIRNALLAGGAATGAAYAMNAFPKPKL